MKQSLLITLLLTVFSAKLFAGDMCDDKCTIVIDFPSGGTLKVLEPITFTFGDSGFINYITSSTAYVDGNTLTLNADDELSFGVGGYIDIGDAGNIEYSSIELSSPSEIIFTIGAVGDTETVNIENITVTGDVAFDITDASLVLGNLNIDGYLEATAAEGSITQTSALTVTGNANFSASDSIILDDSGNQFSTVDIGGTSDTIIIDGNFGTMSVQCSTNESSVTISTGFFEPNLSSPLTLCDSGILNSSGILESGFALAIVNPANVSIVDSKSEEPVSNTSEKSGSTPIFFLLFLNALFLFKRFSFKA